MAAMIDPQISVHPKEAESYFICSRLNGTTFMIHENDKWEEHPYIYIKIYDDPALLVLSDTGCGGSTNKGLHSRHLREYLETCPIDLNHGHPLNPRGPNGQASKKYLIICTHCHYDHILGLGQFQEDSIEIVAAAGGKEFVENDLP